MSVQTIISCYKDFLQLTLPWHTWQTDDPPDRLTTHLTDWQPSSSLFRMLHWLHWLPARKWVDFKMLTSSTVQCLAWGSGFSGHRLSASLCAFCWLQDLCHQADRQALLRLVLHGCRPEAVVQPSGQTDMSFKHFKSSLKTFTFRREIVAHSN